MGLQYDPWKHASDLGLTIIEERLPAKLRGEYRHGDQLILLARGMSHRQARSTLAHEIQHAIAGDTPTQFGPRHHLQERRACRAAAFILIDPHEYAEAERLREGHLSAIAYDLVVTRSVISDWRHYWASVSPSSLMALRASSRLTC